MSFKSHWKPKRKDNQKSNNYHQNKKRYVKRINHHNKQTSQNKHQSHNNNTATWKPKTDLRLQRIKQFVTFFTSKHHSKHDIENCHIYITKLLNKLNKNDILILLNHSNKKQLINALSSNKQSEIWDFYKHNCNNFSPVSHCIFNIGNSWKYEHMDCKSQLFIINQWIKLIKLLFEYNANPFQCIYCPKDLNIYDQYCFCFDRPKSANISKGEPSNLQYLSTTNKREMYKLHSTPFKHLFLFFREDLHQVITDKKIEKHNEFWWIKIEQTLTNNDRIKYSNVHNGLFEILQYILNKYNEILPLIRCQFGKIHLGPTSGYCDYEWKLIPFHCVFPVFPSYNMLYKLLSINQIVPFTFVNFSKYCTNVITNEKELNHKMEPQNEQYLLLAEFGQNLWNERNVYKFIKNHTNKAFDIAKKYSCMLQNYTNYSEYESIYGFGSFYEDICQYLAYEEPDLVKELCEYSPNGIYNKIIDYFQISSDSNNKYNIKNKNSRIIDCIYDSMSDEDIINYLNKYDHNTNGMKDDFPINYSICLLFTMQQIKNNQISAAIWCVQPLLSETIVSLILEWSYVNKYDEYFDGSQFLSNYDNIQKCILLMKKYNIFNENKNNKKFIPFKHRTTNYVINTWVNAFKNIQFKHEFFKPILTLNNNKLEERRKIKINKINKNKYISHFYINIGHKYNNKFDILIDLLLQLKNDNNNDNKMVIVCQNNETVNELDNNLLIQNNNDIISMKFFILGETCHCDWLKQCGYGIIANYETHITQYRNDGYAILILYDIPLNIDEYYTQINGYLNIISLVTNNEYKTQCIQYKNKYKINMIELTNKNNNLINIISEKNDLFTNVSNNIKIYYVNVEKEDYKLATLFDLYNIINHKHNTIVCCNSMRKVKWIREKINATNKPNIFITNDMNYNFNTKEFALLINYDFPVSEYDYLCRINNCKSIKIIIDFVTNSENQKMKHIETFCNITMTELPVGVDSIFE